MKKKLLAIVVACLMASTLLAACGGGGGSTTAAPEAAPEAAAEEVTEAAAEATEAAAEAADTAAAESGDRGTITITDLDAVLSGYDWTAEGEEDWMHYTEYEEEFGEVTTDMVPEDFSIGVVSMASSNNYWINLNEGVQERCDELGITTQIEYVDAPNDFEGTLTNAENLYNQKFDAYIFSPENDTCLAEITKTIVDDGYPVINAYCEEIPAATCFIGSIDSATVIDAAKLGAEIVGDNGTIGVAMGNLGTKLAMTRTGYFEKYLLDETNIRIEEIPAQWDPTNARSMTTDLLTANKDVGYIFCNNDDLALGVYEGLREANATDTVKVVGMDGTKQGLQSVKAGEIYGTYWNNPKLIGRLCVDAAVRAAIGQEIPRVIRTDVELVTADNIDEYYTD